MKLIDEDTSKIMVSDLPELSEYSQIIHDAQEAGEQVGKDSVKCLAANDRAWREIMNLMGRCIARGMRLERGSMKSREEILAYLAEAERSAITSLAANKWERFGYWAATSVHLRKILGLTATASPFRPFADLARRTLSDE